MCRLGGPLWSGFGAERGSTHLVNWLQHAQSLIDVSGVMMAQAQERPPAGDMRPMLIMFAVLAFFYIFMVARPQRAEQKKRQAMLDAVAKGDGAVTIGGIHGTVQSVDPHQQTIQLEIAPKLIITVNKSALSSVTPKSKGGKEAAEKTEKTK